jgi:putative hydrolase of the HAD superfamily
MPKTRALLVDLDGVLRIWPDADAVYAIEAKYGLARGSIAGEALRSPLLTDAVHGRVTKLEWLHVVGRRLGCVEAVLEWSHQPASVSAPTLQLVSRIAREQAIPLALVTNATTELDEELRDLGLANTFDLVFNSARIRHAKPSAEIYRHVLHTVGVSAGQVCYVDDTESHVASARRIGIRAHRYVDDVALRNWLETEIS